MLTTANKTTPAALAPVGADLNRDLSTHAAAHPEIAVTSAVTGDSIAELRAALAALAAPQELG